MNISSKKYFLDFKNVKKASDCNRILPKRFLVGGNPNKTISLCLKRGQEASEGNGTLLKPFLVKIVRRDWLIKLAYTLKS